MTVPQPPITEWATEDEKAEHFRTVVAPDCTHCGVNPCYSLCPNSLDYYSPEREREDSFFQESLSDAEFRSLAYSDYEREHGEPYVS